MLELIWGQHLSAHIRSTVIKRGLAEGFYMWLAMLSVAMLLWSKEPNPWPFGLIATCALIFAPRRVVLIIAILLFVAARLLFGFVVIRQDIRLFVLAVGVLAICGLFLWVSIWWHRRAGKEFYSEILKERASSNSERIEFAAHSVGAAFALLLIWVMRHV